MCSADFLGYDYMQMLSGLGGGKWCNFAKGPSRACTSQSLTCASLRNDICKDESRTRLMIRVQMKKP
jgi:hypothetical protein